VQELINRHPEGKVWVDKAYLEFAPGGASMESLAASTKNLFVVKSLSKIYGLSGARVAYLVAHPDSIRELWKQTPPWIIGTAALAAAKAALQDETYYQQIWSQSARLTCELATSLKSHGFQIWHRHLPCVLVHVPGEARMFADRARDHGVVVRVPDAFMGVSLGNDWIRVGLVKDRVDDVVQALVAAAKG